MSSDGEWRLVPGFPNYECNRKGQFRNAKTGHILAKRANVRTKRMQISFSKDGRTITPNTAPLLAAAWIGPRPANCQVDHVDGIKTNESIENLEYVTQSMNVKRSYDNGLHPNRVGPAPFLNEDDYARIHQLWAEGKNQCDIGKIMGCSNAHVSRILSGKRKPRTRPAPRERKPTMQEKFETALERAAFHLRENPSLGAIRLGRLMGVAESTAQRYLQELRRRLVMKLKENADVTPHKEHSSGDSPPQAGTGTAEGSVESETGSTHPNGRADGGD